MCPSTCPLRTLPSFVRSLKKLTTITVFARRWESQLKPSSCRRASRSSPSSKTQSSIKDKPRVSLMTSCFNSSLLIDILANHQSSTLPSSPHIKSTEHACGLLNTKRQLPRRRRDLTKSQVEQLPLLNSKLCAVICLIFFLRLPDQTIPISNLLAAPHSLR